MASKTKIQPEPHDIKMDDRAEAELSEIAQEQGFFPDASPYKEELCPGLNRLCEAFSGLRQMAKMSPGDRELLELLRKDLEPAYHRIGQICAEWWKGNKGG